mmetsp:Transcript_34741/g.88902  ORF Transcript_34741/g.88902 Transcript_34741/m.88902 type:complete len:300 (+) Transcript_34741:252-1151(+)
MPAPEVAMRPRVDGTPPAIWGALPAAAGIRPSGASPGCQLAWPRASRGSLVQAIEAGAPRRALVSPARGAAGSCDRACRCASPPRFPCDGARLTPRATWTARVGRPACKRLRRPCCARWARTLRRISCTTASPMPLRWPPTCLAHTRTRPSISLQLRFMPPYGLWSVIPSWPWGSCVPCRCGSATLPRCLAFFTASSGASARTAPRCPAHPVSTQTAMSTGKAGIAQPGTQAPAGPGAASHGQIWAAGWTGGATSNPPRPPETRNHLGMLRCICQHPQTEFRPATCQPASPAHPCPGST